MRYNLIARAQQMCAFVLLLVASEASAQDIHTAKAVHPQGVYRIDVELSVEPVGGELLGDNVSLNHDGVLNVMWFSREFSCVGDKVSSDLRARFTVPEQAILTCHPSKGVSPNHTAGISAVRARMVASIKGVKDGEVTWTQVLFDGTYNFTYTGTVTKSASLNVTVKPVPLTWESPQLQDALASLGSYSGRRYTLAAGYNPYVTKPDTHGLQAQFGYALVDPAESRIVPELGAHMGWGTTTLPVKAGARNIQVSEEDARMFTYTIGGMLNGVVRMYDTVSGWHGELIFGAIPGLRVHSSVKEVVAQLPNDSVVWDDQVTRYSFWMAGQAGFRFGYEGIFLSPVIMAEVSEEPFASGDGLNTEWRGNVLGGLSLGLQFPWKKTSEEDE